jgi:16S rRNA (uracil1498-N3)-methyltransferase
MSRTPRIYLPDMSADADTIVMGDQAARHLVRVLRLRAGDELSVFDGRGLERRARLRSAGKREAVAELHEVIESRCESPLHVTLLQGICRGERMDYVMQKATELGVSTIRPVVTARCVVRPNASRVDKKLAHWAGVAASACEQCGRAVVPVITAPVDFDNAIAEAAHEDLKLVMDPRSGRPPGTYRTATDRVTVVIGPEGGLDQAEISAALDAGFQAASLGPRVMRTETAAVAILAVLQSLWGDLGP